MERLFWIIQRYEQEVKHDLVITAIESLHKRYRFKLSKAHLFSVKFVYYRVYKKP